MARQTPTRCDGCGHHGVLVKPREAYRVRPTVAAWVRHLCERCGERYSAPVDRNSTAAT